MSSAKVIIIGAGVAGLSAAAHLSQNGVNDLIILEARGQVGGRLMVQEHNGRTLHMGAQFVHGICEENSMFLLARKHGLLHEDMERDGQGDMHHSSFDTENMYTSEGLKIPEDCAEMAGQIHTRICDKLQNFYPKKDISKADTCVDGVFQTEAEHELKLLEKEISKDKLKFVETALYGCFQNIVAGYAGDATKRCSAFLFGATRELPGGDLILPTSIVEALKSEIQGLDSKLRLGHKVSKIRWNQGQKVTVVANGLEFRADFCISTLPAGVMKKYQNELFEPPLPKEKSEAFDNIMPGAISKYFVEWKKPWWPCNDVRKQSKEALWAIMTAWTKEEMENINLPDDWIKGVFELSADKKTNGTLMLVWIVGDCARAADQLPDEKIKMDLGKLLNRFLAREDIPPPDFLYRNSFTQDEFSLGSYSAASVKANYDPFAKTGLPLPDEQRPKLLFAGEATHPSLWSFLHGARDTGIREANRILSQFALQQVSRL